jgi:hypothetical protein
MNPWEMIQQYATEENSALLFDLVYGDDDDAEQETPWL